MTPVMERCPCEAHYPLAECVQCTPTPPEGRNPDHSRPVQPITSSQVDDPHGLAQPNTARVLAITTGICLALDIAIVACVVKAVEWLLGLLG